MDYNSVIYVLIVMTLCSCSMIYAQRHSFQKQNFRRIQSNGFNSQPSTSEGQAFRKSSMMISDPSNAFNFRQNSRRELELNNMNNFHNRQTERRQTIRNRPVNSNQEKGKNISPSFSMPVLPDIQKQRRINKSNRNFVPTTTLAPVLKVESAVVSKPYMVPGWVGSQNGQPTRPWQRNGRNSKSRADGRTDEYIYMVNGHPARKGNFLNEQDPQNQQQNTNFNNGKRSSMNSLPLNGNNLNKNNEQFQNSNYKKNTVHPLFQHTINSRRFGRMNMGDGGANRQTAGVTGGVPNSGSLSNSQWGEGTLGSPGNLMTLTPNENGIGMNRIHTTAASDNYLPSTVSVRLPKNGHLLPSVMPQLSPTRRAEPPLSHSRHQTVISSGMAPIPQTRQYVDSPIAVKKIPIPSPQPAEISVQPIESFHISTRRVQQGNSRPTSMKVGPPTSGFNHAPFPSYSINNQEVNPSSMPGLTQTTKSNARINVQRRPMDHPGLAIDMMVPGVEYMEPRQTGPRPTVGQQIGPLPSPLPRQHIGPKSFNGQQRRHRGPMPTIRHDTGPHPTNGQHMSPQTPMVEYIRPRPTPTQGPRPTIGNQIRTYQPPNPNFGPRPMTGRHIGPHPTPSQNMGPRSTTAQHVRPITPDVGMEFIQPSVQPIMQRPVPSQSTRPIKSPRQPIGDIPQLSRSMHGSISPQQTQSEIHMIPNQPSMPLLGKMPGTPIPEKVLRNQQMLPLQQHPRAPLMGVMPSAKPLREKINWQMHSPLPANGHGQVSHPWSTTRTHSVGPIYSSISQNGPNIGMNVRPTRIAPSQGSMPQDWSQSSSTSLILPSARPTKSTSGLVNGQVISHSTDEPIPIIETTSNDIIKLTTYDNVADKTSDYISMTWLPQNNPGVSPSIDQASKGHVTVSKPRVDDDNGDHKNSKYKNGKENGKNGMENGKNGMENGKNGKENGDNGYYETKPTTGSRKDVPVTKTTVKVSPSQPVRRVYVKLQDGKDNHQRMNNVSKTTPATPKYSSSSDPKGTISSLDMFLIQTSGQIGPESPPTETKTMSTTNMITNNKPKPKKVTKEKTVLEPVIPSTKTSGKQSMRIFDINAFSIIRSQFLPKTDVKTTAQTPKRPSSTASLQELTKRLPVVSKSVVGSTQASLRSSVRNVDTRTDSMLKSATTTEPTTTTKRTIIFRNRNIIPPALQEIMDALKRPYYQAGVPINLNQVYAPEATETPEIQKTRNTNVGGFDIGNINGNIQGNPDLIPPATTTKKSVITPPPTQPTPPPTTTTIATTTRPLTTTRATTTTTKPTTTMVVSTTETIPGMSSEKQMSFKSMKTSFVNPNIQSHQNYSYNSPTAGFISEQSTQQPFFDAKKEVNQNLFIQPSAEPTSDTDQTSTVSEQAKTSIFFGMWSPTPQNDSTTGDTHNSQPTSASTSGDHTSDNGIPYPTLSQDHLTPTDAVPSPTSAQSKSPVEVKGTEASDNGYNSVPVANLISESLQKNITDVRQQLGDIFYPSPEEPTTELPLTYSTTTSSYQLPGESSTTTLPPEDKTPPEPAVTAPPVTPAPTNGRIKTLFGPRNSPYQGIIIDSSFTMTFPRDSSTPTSLPSAPKGSNSASQKFETSSNVQNPPSLFDAQLPTQQSESNFDVQKQSQRSASTYNGKAKTQERNSNSQIRTHDFQSSFNTRKTSRKTSSSTARSRSGFYSQQGAKTSKSNKPKPSNSIKTLFEVPYLFDYMKSPFPNEDAGVKHRFLKPKTAQGADKPFETAGSLPVPVATVTAASIARTVKDVKPSTPASNRKYDPATGKTRSNPKRKTKKKTMHVATANGKPKIDKVVPTAGSGIKTVTERRGIPINANFMEHLPFFVGAVDSKLFQGMQLLGGGGVGPGRSQVSARKTNSRSTTTPVAVARSARSTSLPTTKASPKKLEYDLKVLCMQFLRWNTNNHMYIPHPGDCSKIIECTPEGNEMHAAARHCPLGLFWDPNTQRCSDPGDVTCFDDPCQKGYYNYTSHGGCGTYYSCLGGVSVPTCCPSGYRFVQTTKDSGNCIWDTSCSEPCETLQSSRLRKTGACPALEVEARTDAYWILQRGSLILKTCPEGSVYNHKECKCKSTTAPTMPSRPSSARDSAQKCSPEFKLTFDGGIVKDVSGGGLAFSQVNVAGTDNNTAIFRENGYISLWGFQNRYLGRTFSIRMRLRADKGSCRSSARSIVSNCGPDGPTSVEIACDNNNVAFKANTDNRKVPTVVRRTIKDNEWTDIIYTYKGNKFSGSVNERKFSKSLTGNLVSRNNPLIIGKCPKSPGFIGEIDQLEIYTHCVP